MPRDLLILRPSLSWMKPCAKTLGRVCVVWFGFGFSGMRIVVRMRCMAFGLSSQANTIMYKEEKPLTTRGGAGRRT